jgi:hypothetical protein
MSADEVEIDVFSGRPNPRWKLTGNEALNLRKRILALQRQTSPPIIPGLGFRGFIVRLDDCSATVYGGCIILSCSSRRQSVFADTQGIEDALRRQAKKHGFSKIIQAD